MDHLAAGVLVLALAREGDREHVALGARLHQVDARVLHRDLRAEVAVHPFHGRVAIYERALGHQVEDVGRPVLDGRVAAASVLLDDDLDHRGVERIGRVDGGRAALDVVHERALVADDQRALELTHVLRVDAEVGLQRDLHAHALRHVDERPTRPDRAVQSRELVVRGRDDRAEVLLEELGVIAQRGVRVGEDDALLGELLVQGVVDDLRLVLSRDAGQELALGLGHAQPVVRGLDVRRQVLPARGLLVGRPQVIEDVLEVDHAEVCAPRRHRLLAEDLEGAKPELQHPLRLLLHPRDLLDDLWIQAALGLEDEVLGDGEAVLLLVIGANVDFRYCRHQATSLGSSASPHSE